ncbi:uncharacterized protein A4U43_C07F23080 [Asparagus officinalis]|uniref:Uncharacterized protein n=1 Tax=Asparagus officinalis TaxID=4686 RepID=A0A5P1EED4_ASPOF|nr:uncharacterized protein A4U43_C07F23080 [Asparagus officinalis]
MYFVNRDTQIIASFVMANIFPKLGGHDDIPLQAHLLVDFLYARVNVSLPKLLFHNLTHIPLPCNWLYSWYLIMALSHAKQFIVTTQRVVLMLLRKFTRQFTIIVQRVVMMLVTQFTMLLMWPLTCSCMDTDVFVDMTTTDVAADMSTDMAATDGALASAGVASSS